MEWKYLKYDLEYRWENFKLRKWINDNPQYVIYITAGSVVLLLFIFIFTVFSGNTSYAEKQKYVWFYDINTGELFKDKAKLIPPIEAPSGPLPDGSQAGVLAYVFTYNDSNGVPKTFIAYLEKMEWKFVRKSTDKNLTPEEKIRNWASGRMIKRPEDVEWFRADSEEALKIVQLKHLPKSLIYSLKISYPE